jgi:hypothetical protein
VCDWCPHNGHNPTLLASRAAARPPGAALVDEARRVGADLLYLDAVHPPPSEQALGPTATYLLAHRPTRVVIETAGATPLSQPPAPDGYPARRGRHAHAREAAA